MTYFPNNPNWQAAMANSAPVVIASNQTAVPISGTVSSKTQDNSGVGIDSLSAGTGANGLITAQGATNFFVSTANGSTAQLAAGATFNGTIESVLSAPYASVIIDTDQPGTLVVKQYITSSAGTQIINTSFSVPAKTSGSCFGRSFPINGNFFSISFTNNGASTTTTLNINVAYGNIDATTQLLNAPVSLNEVNGTALSLGQTTMSASLPVAIASNQTPITDIIATGNITTVNLNPWLGATVGSAIVLPLSGQSAASIQITGTWVATLQFEASTDGVNWIPINGVFASASTPSSTISTNGLVRLTPAGVAQMRIVATAFTSGTVVITIRASIGTGGTFVNQILPTFLNDAATTGNITTQNLVPAGTATAGSAVLSGSLNGMSSASVQVTGTYTGALSVQATTDNVNWITIGGTPLLNINTAVFSATIASATVGIFQIEVSAFRQIRVTGLAAMTGTATVSIQVSNGTSIVSLDTAIPTGTNSIGNIGTVAAVTSVNAIIPGTGATNLGKARGTATGTTDTGVIALGTRIDALATQGTANANQQFIVDSLGSLQVNQYEKKAKTYSMTWAVGLLASATDVITITGNASNTCYVTKISVSGSQTTMGTVRVNLIKRSTANTGGTPNAGTAIPHDSNDAAAVSTTVIYSAYPTLWTPLGNIRSQLVAFWQTTTTTNNAVVFDFGIMGRPIVLRGVAQTLAINLDGATIAGGTLYASIEWFEI